jgi:uncharacterized membrane protein YeaQ/YmgE (transglycosylase-associated protein family)
MLLFILGLLVAGIVVGGIARLLVPGPDPMGCLGTALLGIAGSIVGGFLWNLFQYHTLYQRSLHPVGLIGSIIGAIVLLLLMRLFRGGGRRYYR